MNKCPKIRINRLGYSIHIQYVLRTSAIAHDLYPTLCTDATIAAAGVKLGVILQLL